MASSTAKEPIGPPPSGMKAQFLDAYNKPYALRSAPLPTLTSPHDLLLRVDAASYCHTDAVLAAGQMPPFPAAFPHVGCHEFAGTVVAVAPSYAPSHAFAPGDRVGAPGRAFHACGACFECQNGERSTFGAVEPADADAPGYSAYCPSAENCGISRDGGFAEYVVVDERQVVRIPDGGAAGERGGEGLSAVDVAPLMCAGVTVYGALKRCRLRAGQRVGIVGCGGGLGHLGLQFAEKMGLRVLGVEAADAPLRLAQGLGTAARIVDARKEKAEDVVKELGEEDGRTERGEMGLDAVIILPESQNAFDYGMALLRNHAKCVIVSFPEKGFHMSAWDVVFRNISIIGSLVGSNKVTKEMLDFAAEHNVRASIKTFPLSKLNELVEEYHKGEGGKLVVDMSLERSG